ncbi:quercetin dioxygenase-like cupin family protein [Hamadaea flava]|uniref:Cupin domain-containing protein n=1 Tax=Hamadaea flava TaxID=1742688 RepID=A0ABV8LYC8_9ACTN|nr:cupin domain-containing protein [Hamadaea flava]MCP2329350.1 quercetin dioxygenase-like cupin family protein [Hamadaea flava]
MTVPVWTDTNGVAATGAEQIRRQPWMPVAGCPGVFIKELSRRGELADVLLRIEPGASTPGRPHQRIEQHIWVLEGEASIGLHRLSVGGYTVVPPGTAHPIHAIGSWGCVLLQSQIPLPADSLTEIVSTSCQQ